MLLIDNETVAKVLTMAECIDAQDASFRRLANGLAVHRPRIDVYTPASDQDHFYRWGSMEGADAELGIFAIRMKSDVISWPRDRNGRWTEDKFCREPGTYCGLVWLFSTQNGVPLAIIHDGLMQHFRVGGGAGLGVRYLARQEASRLAVIGSGGMARTYLEAITHERPIQTIRVFSPTRAHREAFAQEITATFKIAAEAADSPQAAMRGADIVATCTDSMEPVIDAAWIEPGMHLTNLGPREWGEDIYARADVVIRQGLGGLDIPESPPIYRDRGHSPLAYVAGTREDIARMPTSSGGPSMFTRQAGTVMELMTGQVSGRTSPDQVTAYINVGNQGLQFASVGERILTKVREQGLGRELPTEWFLQDIRD